MESRGVTNIFGGGGVESLVERASTNRKTSERDRERDER